jgi:hypothetical protein
MVGSHLVISAVVTAAALAGCLAYLLRPPIPSAAVDQQPHLGKFTLGAPDAMALRGPDWQPVENEKAATAYLEAAQAILRRAKPRRRPRVPMRYRSRDVFRYLESVRSRGFNWVA